MTGKWFWCPRCNRIAPQLNRGQVARIKRKSKDSDELDFDRIIRRIVFTLANPLLILKLSFWSFVNGNKVLCCDPCKSNMELLESKDPKVLSALNHEDLVKAGLIKR